jgi:2-keto-3-deoxy-6-phosphogluconate aldolase
MAKSVIGLFDNMSEARQVVQELVDNGFRRDDISLVAQHEGETITERGDDRTSGVAVGAGAGAAVGGLGGLLVGH